MSHTSSLLGPPVQIAYSVVDIERAVESWVRSHGAGPFFVYRHIPVHSVVHRGRPASFDHTSAYGQLGGLMIELVCDHTAGPSPVKDLLGEAGCGLHHMAHFVADGAATRAALANFGCPEIFRASTGGGGGGGGQFFFHDARASLGHMIELYEPDTGVRQFYKMVADAARDWDGQAALRELG